MSDLVKKVAEKYALDQMVSRVAARVINALSVGRTFESDKWRVHRFSDFVRVTHLENAGKRGKKCQEMALNFESIKGKDLHESIVIDIVDHARRNVSLGQMEKLLQEYVEDYAGTGSFGSGLKLRTYELRGVDVIPAGFEPLRITTKNVELRVELKDFSIRDLSEVREIKDKDDKVIQLDYPNQPTCIPASSSNKDLPVFYRWVKDNQSKLNSMKYEDFLKVLKDLGIPYHTYCAMD